MMLPTKEDIEKHCRNCIHNTSEYWCDEYGVSPGLALIFCSENEFEAEEKKEEE